MSDSNRPSDWGKRRELVIERDGSKCQNCGNRSVSELEVHHIVPLSRGGSNKVSNLTTLCQDCHDSVHYESKTAPDSKRSKTESKSMQTSSSFGKLPTTNQMNCPKCTYSFCTTSEYNERTLFCQKCERLWRFENGNWRLAPCPECGSRDGFTWGRDGRLGSCNQCNRDVNSHKEY